MESAFLPVLTVSWDVEVASWSKADASAEELGLVEL
jgi:hypothetical protein